MGYPIIPSLVREESASHCGMLQQSYHGEVQIGNGAYLGDHECLEAACWPRQRSIIGPQRYTIVEGLSGTLRFDKVKLVLVVLKNY